MSVGSTSGLDLPGVAHPPADTAAPASSRSGNPPIVLRPGPAELDPRKFARREKLLTKGLSIVVPIVLLLCWQFASDWGVLDARFFPAPTEIVAEWGDLIGDGTFWTHLWASTRRITYGYVLGCGSGVLLGLLIGRSKFLRAALEPTIVALYTVPKLAILPLLLLIFGIGESPKVLLIAIAVFFIALINTTGALEAVPAAHLEAAKSFGLGRWDTVRHIVLPSALPSIFLGLRLSAGIAVLVVVGAEFVAANEGLGFLVWNSWSIGIPSRMYIGIVAIAILGVLANSLLRFLQRLAVPWER